MVIYVNGKKYFEDSGWDTAHQIPDSVLAQPWYVYYTDWQGCCDHAPAYRFSWGRLAVNPHDAAGNILPPSASPTFGQPVPTPVPTAIATRTATPSATSTPIPTPVPTAPAIAPCRVRVSINGGPDQYVDAPNAFCGLP